MTAPVPGYVAGTWQLDPAHSTVSFSVRHLVTKFRGRFADVSATLTTADRVEDSAVEAQVRTASISTGNPDRDAHLRTPDFFDSEQHPEIAFVSTGVSGSGDEYQVTGDLTIRGVTRSVTLDTEIGGIATSPYGQTVLGVEAETRIRREDFGLEWNAALETGGVLLGSDVRIRIEAEFILQAA